MNQRVYKHQVIEALKREGYDYLHTLRKEWRLVNGIPRYGWHIHTIYGWTMLGETLADVLNYLDWRKDERETRSAQP
jgi:hypothetical protein